MSSTVPATRGGGPHDLFATPAWVTEALLRAVEFPDGTWFEPAVAEGAIVRAVERVRPGRQSWVACEIRDVATPPYVDGRSLYHGDFLTMPALAEAFAHAPPPACIITNPPFRLAEPFARRALALAAPQGATVALLLRLAYLESEKRLPFHRAYPSDVYVLARRPSFTSDGATDSAAYAWFVWGPGRGHRWQILEAGTRCAASSGPETAT